MLNKFTNPRSWVVASLLAAASIFGQSSQVAADSSCAPKKAPEQKCAPQKAPEAKPNCNPKPACPPKPCCPERPELKLNCAYNAPARVEVDSCSCWDFYAGASFIYWEAMQDNMEYAASVSTNYATSSGAATDYFAVASGHITTGEIQRQDFKYKPGFKVLVGMNFDRDHWDGYAEYTWFSSKTTSSVSVGANTATSSVGVAPLRGNGWMIDQIVSATGTDTSIFNSGSQEWDLSFQALDAAIARTYYVGTKLTFRTIMGARFAWFSQRAEQTFVSTGSLGSAAAPAGTYNTKQNFSSWGAGLMAGLNTSWMLGEGFSMIGNGSFDLLYTRVQASNSRFSWTEVNFGPSVFRFPEDRPDFVMPHTNLEFGFAWGSYFDCYNWHVDFAATYNFQAFWNANLFRSFPGNVATVGSLPNGNLYMHGLNISARLDF